MPALDDLDHVLRPAAGEPAGALVLLHGPGASEADVGQLAEILDPQRRLTTACPRGTVSAPGSSGYRWYVDREPGYPQRDTFEASLDVLQNWLATFAADTGIPAERTIFGGFSQGATMAWALVLGAGRPRAGGLIALSGFIPRVSDFELDDGALRELPVAICHGTQDPRVPVDHARSAKERATVAGAELLYRETDVPHVLDFRVVPELVSWLGDRFTSGSATSGAPATP